METTKKSTTTPGDTIADVYETLHREREQQLGVLHDTVLAGRALMQIEARRLQQKAGVDDARAQGVLKGIEQSYQVARSLAVEVEIARAGFRLAASRRCPFGGPDGVAAGSGRATHRRPCDRPWRIGRGG